MMNLEFAKQTPQFISSRYFYTNNRLFEQSLDIYEPLNDDSDNFEKPLIVLVVGSGWMGHRSFIYAGTSWWNASAPITFAKLGYTCVTIRHRGTFPQMPPLSVVLSFLAALAAFLVKMYDYSWENVAKTASIIMVSWIALVIGGYGAATFDDMIEDVADALVWVDNNIVSDASEDPNHEEKKEDDNKRLMIFGGYSSGGHVAASLLQRRGIFENRGLPPPEDLIDGIIFLSGVLAVRPRTKDLGNRESALISQSEQPSRWFADLLTLIAFGKEGALTTPSPLDGIPPKIPHLLLGCTKEVFGLTLMDLLFCSKEFARLVETSHDGSVPARCVEVDSVNHWNILASPKFSQVLCNELRSFTSVAFSQREGREIARRATLNG